jgi:hypothetical protein
VRILIINKLLQISFILTTGLKRVPRKRPKLSDARTHIKHIKSIMMKRFHSKGCPVRKYDREM